MTHSIFSFGRISKYNSSIAPWKLNMACKLVERQAQSVSSNRLFTYTTDEEPRYDTRDDIQSQSEHVHPTIITILNHASCIEATTAGSLLNLPSLNYGVDLRLDSACIEILVYNPASEDHTATLISTGQATSTRNDIECFHSHILAAKSGVHLCTQV